MSTHYEVLGIPTDASEADVRHAYRVQIRQWHPDIAGEEGATKTAAINHACDVLRDAFLRREYDREIGVNQPKQQEQPSASQQAHQAPPAAEEQYVSAEPPTYAMPHEKRNRCITLAALVLAVGGVVVNICDAQLGVFQVSPVLHAVLVLGVVLGLAGVGKVWMRYIALLLPALWLAELTVPFLNSTGTLQFWISGTVAAFATVVFRHLRDRRIVFKHNVHLANEWFKLLSFGNDVRCFFVEAVAGTDGVRTDALVSDFADHEFQLALWGTTTQGSWIAVNSVGRIIYEVPNAAPVAWNKLNA